MKYKTRGRVEGFPMPVRRAARDGASIIGPHEDAAAVPGSPPAHHARIARSRPRNPRPQRHDRRRARRGRARGRGPGPCRRHRCRRRCRHPSCALRQHVRNRSHHRPRTAPSAGTRGVRGRWPPRARGCADAGTAAQSACRSLRARHLGWSRRRRAGCDARGRRRAGHARRALRRSRVDAARVRVGTHRIAPPGPRRGSCSRALSWRPVGGR